MKNRIRSFLSILKHSKPTDENIFRLFLPSFAGIIICMGCLAGATWAWFSVGITTPPQTITGACYDVSISINGEDMLPENGKYTLQSGENKVKLAAVGNAATGYCKICINDVIYYTPQFPDPDDRKAEFALTVKVSEAAEMTVVPIWGIYSGSDVLDGTLLDLTIPQSGDQSQSEDSVPPQTMTDAQYDVSISIDGVDVPSENGKYLLQSGENTVKFTAAENASAGYCKICINDILYYTPQFPDSENQKVEFILTVRVSEATEMTVVPVEGVYTGKDVLDGTLLDLTIPQSGDQNQPEGSALPSSQAGGEAECHGEAEAAAQQAEDADESTIK